MTKIEDAIAARESERSKRITADRAAKAAAAKKTTTETEKKSSSSSPGDETTKPAGDEKSAS